MKKEVGTRNLALLLARSGIMAALVAAATFVVQIPNPATGGYINFGDIMIFASSFLFGPVVGGFAGAVGASIADLASPYAYYAPYTFVIKGIEGIIAGIISNQRSIKRDTIAVALAGSEMVTGYFLAQAFVLQLGVPAALTEVPWNVSQIIVGAVVGIPLAFALRKRLPESWISKTRRPTPTT